VAFAKAESGALYRLGNHMQGPPPVCNPTR
jgi:hypothetical protein